MVTDAVRARDGSGSRLPGDLTVGGEGKPLSWTGIVEKREFSLSEWGLSPWRVETVVVVSIRLGDQSWGLAVAGMGTGLS